MPLGYEPEGRMFESCRAHHLTTYNSDVWSYHRHSFKGHCVCGMPRSMPTARQSCPIHRGTNRLFLRVDIALRDVHVAVPGEVCPRPGKLSRVPPAFRQSVKSPFAGKPGSSTMRTEPASLNRAAETTAACFLPGAPLSGKMTTERPRRVSEYSGRHLPAPIALQVASRPSASSE